MKAALGADVLGCGMHAYFIDTLVGETQCPDRVGTEFSDFNAAIATAFSVLLDIAQDEVELDVEIDVSICVRDFSGKPIFNGLLRTLRVGEARCRTEPLLAAEKVRGAPAIGVTTSHCISCHPRFGMRRHDEC